MPEHSIVNEGALSGALPRWPALTLSCSPSWSYTTTLHLVMGPGSLKCHWLPRSGQKLQPTGMGEVSSSRRKPEKHPQ